MSFGEKIDVPVQLQRKTVTNGGAEKRPRPASEDAKDGDELTEKSDENNSTRGETAPEKPAPAAPVDNRRSKKSQAIRIVGPPRHSTAEVHVY